MENIDVIFYINLEHRTDRKAHILEQLKLINPNLSKVVRIDAIRVEHRGILGCTLSHLKAVEEFEKHPEWKTCIIFEDDYLFKDTNMTHFNNMINDLFTQFPNWDVLNLAYSNGNFKYEETGHNFIKKLIFAGTASGYCVHKKFVKTLKQNYMEAAEGLRAEVYNWEFANDIYWKHIMPSANWYVVVPRLGGQLPSYSDIEKRDVDYGGM